MTLKHLKAIFIGGCVGMFVVFLVSWWLWPLGMIIGGFVAYIGYDAREWWTAFRDQIHDKYVEFLYRIDLVRKWIMKPHPFWCAYAVILGLFVWFVPARVFVDGKHGIIEAYFMKGILIGFASFFLQSIFALIVERGAVDRKYGLKQRWEGEWFVEKEDMPSDKAFDVYFSHLPSECEKVPASYWNVYRMFIRGLAIMILRAPFYASVLAMTFVIPIVKVHSRTRLMCGIYAGLGIAVTYITTSLMRNIYELSPSEKVIVIAAAGAVGSCLGMILSRAADWIMPKLTDEVSQSPEC